MLTLSRRKGKPDAIGTYCREEICSGSVVHAWCYHTHSHEVEVVLAEDWIDRWNTGRTGWHEPHGNAGLRQYWPQLLPGSRVLVPLCGKSPDLMWLARRRHDVVGVELSEIAARSFFEEHECAYVLEKGKMLDRYVAEALSLEIQVGDYFHFVAPPFDALYDRGALVALSGSARAAYVQHSNRLLKPNATKLVVTLDYDQAIVSGPPFSVSSEELLNYWSDLHEVASRDDLDTCPAKFRAAGLRKIREVFWVSG